MIFVFRCQPARRKICRYVLAVVKQNKVYKFLCTNDFFLLAIIKNALGGTVQYFSAGERAVRVGWGSN